MALTRLPCANPPTIGSADGLVLELQCEVDSRAPREACGLLLGTTSNERAAGQLEQIAGWLPIPNRARGLDRFAFDPLIYAKQEKAARARGCSILGIYHSHPDAPALPSHTDGKAARKLWGMETSWLYLILGRDSNGQPQHRAWRLVSGAWFEQVEPGQH